MASVLINELKPCVELSPLTLVPPIRLFLPGDEQEWSLPSLANLQYRAPYYEVSDAAVFLPGVFVPGRNAIGHASQMIGLQLRGIKNWVQDRSLAEQTFIEHTHWVVPVPLPNVCQHRIDRILVGSNEFVELVFKRTHS